MLRYVLIGAGIIAIIPVVWLAWWLLSPLWTDTEVSEEFPRAARAVIPEGMTMAQVEETMSAAARIERAAAESMPAVAAPTAGQDGPQPRLTGRFRDADSFHRGSGTATIYELGPDAPRVLRLDDFRVTNGPDLRVLLVNAAAPGGHSDLADAGYVELGKLKGNVGSQNYEIPADFDLAKAQSVVIYCDPFRVVFSVASLEPSKT